MKNPSAAQTSRLRLRLTATAESIVRSGHPWVFADSVREASRPGQTGELAVIYDRQDKFLAIGLFDAESPIRVRILHAGKPAMLDAGWFQTRLEQTVARRAHLFGTDTNGYRLINGESDGWPALVLDRYADTLVLKIYSQIWLARLPELQAWIREKVPSQRLILRLSRNIQAAAAQQGRSDGATLYGPAADPATGGVVVFQENGIRFEAEVWRGQKTGFFLDQRENRAGVEKLSAGKTVLNAFSFSGGFSVYAARGGARTVTDIDISAHALDSARRNFALNQAHPAVAACRHRTVQADAFEWIAQAGEKYDVVVLDPPSLAKREQERATAVRAYENLNAQGIQRLARGGVLVAGSCSAHVSAPEFFEAVRRAAAKSGRPFTERLTRLHPPDHAARFKEAEYLKVIYLQFQD